ncbi:MAG TPA: hypothetical protein VE910_05395 [Dongiaceae bacterium]|nr:hypothetical protein [Dongiaceae bacterium]
MRKGYLLLLPFVFTLVGGYFAVLRLAHRADRAQILGHDMADSGAGSVTLLSQTYTLDRIYHSMQGPYGILGDIELEREDPKKVVWITGVETTVMGKDGETAISPEFFCHANLTLSEKGNTPDAHNASFGGETHLDWRLFTLVPGRLSQHLPEGFGVPVLGGEPLDFLAMSLNQNVTDRTVLARFRTKVFYVPDGVRPMHAVFRRALYGYEQMGHGVKEGACMGGSHPGQACGPFQGRTASKHGFVQSVGPEKTIHWLVSPGEYEAHTPVDDQLNLPFDTTVHYVTGHLHPFGVSLALRDLTTDETLFTIKAQDWNDRLGVADMDEISSPEGIALHHDHKYELVTVYNNTTPADIDAMSILYLYCRDWSFESKSSAAADSR